MTKYEVTLERSKNFRGFMLDDPIKDIGKIALSHIPNVEDVRFISENKDSATFSYGYTSSEQFWHTDEHLAEYGLQGKAQ